MSTLELVIQQFGILLTLEQTGTLFHRSPAAMRQAMARRDGVGEILADSVIRRGRRIYFRASDLAKIIDDGQV